MHFVNPTREQFKTIAALPDGQPVCMLNFFRFRAFANYEGTTKSDVKAVLSGRSTYEQYSTEAEFAFKRAGGKQVWIGQPLAMLIGPDDERWDLVFIAQYPAIKAFVELVKSPEYQSATQHRSAALEDSRLIVCAPLQAGPSFAPLA